MKGLRYFEKLTALTMGKLCQQRWLLAGLVLLCLLLPLGAGRAAEVLLSRGVNFAGVTLAITAPEGDGVPQLLEQFMGEMEDIAQYCNIVALEEGAALEALSRGAAEAVVVEQRRDAARLVTENLKLTGLADRARVVNGDALSYLAGAGERFDIVFIDPPYADRLWESAISAIYRFDILANHGIIVCESPVDQEMPAVKAPLFLHRTYRYGRIKITTYHREEGREA